MKLNHKYVGYFGWLSLASGLYYFVKEQIYVLPDFYHRFNATYALADSAMCGLGVLGLIVSECLKNIERKITEIQKSQPARNE